MLPRSRFVVLAIFALLSIIAYRLASASAVGYQHRLGNNGNFHNLDPVWSPDGRHIIFSSDRAGEWDIWIMEADGTNQTDLTEAFSGLTGEASWSPNGKWIVFSSDHTGNNDIWVMKTDGTEPINLTPEMPSNEGDPAWSPDGQLIAFVSTQGRTYGIWVMSAESGEGKRQVSPSDQQTYLVPSWLSDSQTIIFEGGTKESSQIWRASIEGSTAVPLAVDVVYQAANARVCAANDRIAFTNLARNPLGEISVINPDGSGLTTLSPGKQGAGPVWSSDGYSIAFRSLRSGDNDLWVMDSNGSNAINLTKDIDGSVVSPSWSPDGEKIVFSAYVDGDLDIWIVNANGSNPINLTNGSVMP
jgi:Tol biopolymer transport system component